MAEMHMKNAGLSMGQSMDSLEGQLKELENQYRNGMIDKAKYRGKCNELLRPVPDLDYEPSGWERSGRNAEGQSADSGRWGGRASDKAGARDAPVSEAQRRAMGAAMSGKSNIGIPTSVGKEFIEKDPGGHLPEKAK